ncbi:enoyl-CoA hydratase/isomerase family protein [Nocardiopsis alborubida]|uniref:Enoyl-CoA hydratase/isomerase family protein n=1 Tax=Nocardiopsis alborubida TaxID=146802 RepID=A0A7X6RTY5_9ACTN|nr:enoyl-CoA hydratase/isomerase family protein [Nocardiopsis alborubida]NKZ01802.1 enoyl-CoA hydratase/isomerase family protein [Nocardiopsis alborubida]
MSENGTAGDLTTLDVEWREDRVVVQLHRPEARNAINATMIAELHRVCERVEAEPRPLLLTGHGTVFAGGADISELRERGREEALAGINSRLFERLHRLRAPTVAAVDGYALGGGAELAYACDIRIATPTAVFAQPEPGLGIIAGAGACWRLRELVGASVAKQVLLGGYRLDAEAALRHGLVAEVVPSEELRGRAHALIDRMAASSALALRMTKMVLDADGPHPLADDLTQAVLFESADKHERMTRFLERKKR